jgi:predicted amidohydrolase
MRIASLHNGYFTALVNLVGREPALHFSGESLVTDPNGRVIARAPRDAEALLLADCDFGLIGESHARRHFLADRRPAVYRRLGLTDEI